MKVEEYIKKTFKVRKMRFADDSYEDVYKNIKHEKIEGWIDFGAFNPCQNKNIKSFHYIDIYIKNGGHYDIFYVDFNKKKGFSINPKDTDYPTANAVKHMSPALLKYLTVKRLEGKIV